MPLHSSQEKEGYLSLCYHYIRPDHGDEFPRILGNSKEQFLGHLELLRERYDFINLKDSHNFSFAGNAMNKDRYGMLLTFDDGLSDHYAVSEILAEYGIQATFFIPTCILMDRLPPNPNIIHYALAIGGIQEFLCAYRSGIEEVGLSVSEYDIVFTKGVSDPWETIARIKKQLKYDFDYRTSRKILLHVYREVLLSRDPDMIDIMHLNAEQIHKMVDMGHTLGVHTHTHISVGAADLDAEDFDKEIIEPRNYLADEFDTEVYSFSYPFGTAKDCLSTKDFLQKTNVYRLAFTVNEIFNTKEVSPFEIGRYMPHSTDTVEKLEQKLIQIEQGKGRTI